MATPQELADEEKRTRKLRHLVDFATSIIMQSAMTRREAEQLVGAVREGVLILFPGGDGTFEVVYARRFRRLIEEFAAREAEPRGAMIPFPGGDRRAG